MRGAPWPHDDSDGIMETIEEIKRLKKEKNAFILSHYYMPPELQITTARGGVADVVGDSLGLSQAAMRAGAERIVFCGVRFMAETAKILNPEKSVLLPSGEAGCSLASSITGADVRALRAEHPDAQVMAYINTYAETKAECDVCCTSRNALKIAKALPGRRIVFVPDVYMGRNLQAAVARETGKELILWRGVCEVHEQFTRGQIASLIARHPDAEVLVHWEVPEDAVEIAVAGGHGVVGSTNDLIERVRESRAARFIVGSECDLGATLRGLYPSREFITPCVQCLHMKEITLERTRDALLAAGTEGEAEYAITLDADVLQRARVPVERMMALS